MKKRGKLIATIMCAAICFAGLVGSVWAVTQEQFSFNATISFDASDQILVDIEGTVKIGGTTVSTYSYTHSGDEPADWQVGALYFYDGATTDGSHTYTVGGSSVSAAPSDRIEICLEITNYSSVAVAASFSGDGIETSNSSAASQLSIDTIEAPYIYAYDGTTAITHKLIKIYTLNDATQDLGSGSLIANNLTVEIEASTLTPTTTSNFSSVTGDTLVVAESLGSSLTSSNFLSTVPSNVTTVVLPGTMTTIQATGLSSSHNVETVIMSEGTTSIAASAFNNASSVVSIIMPDSCATLNARCFQNTTSLKNVFFGDITDITTIFGSGSSAQSALTYIEVPGSCVTLDFVDIRNKNLKTVVLCEGIASLAIRGGGLLNDIDNDLILNIPASVSSITYEYNPFSSFFKAFYVNENNDYYSSDENGVLFNKNKTILIAYPSETPYVDSYTVPSSVTSIGEDAFAGCNIGTLDLGSIETVSRGIFNMAVINHLYGASVTTIEGYSIQIMLLIDVNFSNLQTIGNNAFSSGSNMPSFTVASSVTSIGNSAFESCSSLTEIYMEGSAPTIGTNAFPIENEGFTIYVNEQYRSSYTSASDWAAYLPYIVYVV